VPNISVDKPDAYVRIRISDTGKGIPSVNMLKIFDPFFTTKEKGSGLDLRYYSIIKKHKGEIDVKAKGTRARRLITLPGYRCAKSPILFSKERPSPFGKGDEGIL
jgi:signal transduction histidine kinase